MVTLNKCLQFSEVRKNSQQVGGMEKYLDCTCMQGYSILLWYMNLSISWDRENIENISDDIILEESLWGYDGFCHIW